MTNFNDITADNFIGVGDNSIEQSIDKGQKDPDVSCRSILDNASKRSEAALNVQNKETDDDENFILYQ